MNNFDDFDIEMYDENINRGNAGDNSRSSLPCIGISAIYSVIYSVSTINASDSGTSAICATMSNITE